MKRKLQALVVFILLGICKLPLEQRTATSLRSHEMLYAPLDYSARDAVGQMGFAATLGGLRSLVASITYLMGYTAFEETNWSRVDMLFGITTMLQPRFDVYWDDAAGHMAYDAASNYLYDESRPTLYRKQLYRENVQRGIDILNEGLRHLPKSDRLHTSLGHLYARRVEPRNHELAGEHYLLAYQNGGLPVMERLAAYEWAQLNNAPERWKQAYTILKRSYGMGLRAPGTMNFMHSLENKLNIPPALRVR
ncbi:MAG: hypothetical protein JWO89_3396 [Verrucomicrobiaceae bacterium]|nr:hypothetical protein [Verrucomicrobiaceae bacterium]